MKDYGLVSIITPSYNSVTFIRDTIEGILHQTYSHWELLITDDCSTDNSIEIIEEYARKNPRIKLTSNPQLSSSASFLRLNVLSSLN